MASPVIDARAASAAYADAFRKLASLSGFKAKDVLRAECGSFLKAWAGETKVARPDQALRRARARALRTITDGGQASGMFGWLTVNAGVRSGAEAGLMWHRTKNRKFQMAGVMDLSGMGHRWSNLHFHPGDWLNMQRAAQKAGDALRKLVPKAQESVGLARQSVVQIADEMGIDLSQVKGGRISAAGLAKARAALASNGRAYKNGSGYIIGDETVKAYADMVNRLPYNTKIGMDITAAYVLQNRAKGIETAWKKGVFESAKKIAGQFPNLVRVAAA